MDAVTATVTKGSEAPPPKCWGDRCKVQSWTVTLRYQGREMVTPFYGGKAVETPTADSVLECLLSDASSCHAGATFRDWCDDYWYSFDANPADALEVFRACVAQSVKLRALLGDDYEAVEAKLEATR